MKLRKGAIVQNRAIGLPRKAKAKKTVIWQEMHVSPEALPLAQLI
jgi:hypothetical protein